MGPPPNGIINTPGHISKPAGHKTKTPGNIPYKCLWCKKVVRVFGSSLSTLYGSPQTLRVSDGFPQRQEANDKGVKLPVTSLHYFNQAGKF
ncbi:hypothetical protein VP01_117g3 [Puccinia sorghi]|uniref:Uncharacterized protein n=1 Tax=Puccinia sorghi TaxID=27349 RepID=A0A0L6VSJ2_9BASI|nr:hypothetical protein VP01_117g3 [Puccinia sorghi]